MEEHEQNTSKIVNFLVEHEAVSKVYYPGIRNHPNHEIAKKQARGFGGMVSFDVGSAKKRQSIKQSEILYTC